MRFWPFLFVLCVSCGGGDDTTSVNHGLGFSFDEISSVSGLRVRYANANPPRLATIESLYEDVAQCMGISPLPSGPLVVIMSGTLAQYGHDGNTFYDPPLIVVDDDITTFDWTTTSPFVVQLRSRTLKHEFVHFLLSVTGFPADRNTAHDSPFFAACAP